MGVMELPLILLLAQTTATLCASGKFRFVNQLATWAEAQSYCRERFADLATVETDEDQARVADMVANSGSTYAWIGLYDDMKSWRWSLDNTSLYAGGEDGFGDWIHFLENNVKSKQHCLVIINDKLHDFSCYSARNSVCYDEPSNTYIPVTIGKTWKSAQSYCRQAYTDLASMRNQQEMEMIMNKTGRTGWWWIGLSREAWKWSDRTDSTLRKWSINEPSGGEGEKCVFANANGWNDALCGYRIPFICSANPLEKKMVKMALRSKGNLDLNDPKIKAAILKQIEKNMRERGVRKFRLTWRKQSTGKVFTLTSPPIDPTNPPTEVVGDMGEDMLSSTEGTSRHCVQKVYVS